MSGHSKWATIKRKKAALDAKRGKLFTRITKEITVAARLGGGDPSGNPRLRLLLEKAREANMPVENTTRAIKRGTGELPGTHYEAQIYEGYGPHGTAFLVETLTDNKNRTVSELRRIFSSNGGALGETNSVAWMFNRVGTISAVGEVTEDELIEKLIDFSVIDISFEDGQWHITCDPKETDAVRHALEQIGMTVKEATLAFIAQNHLTLEGEQAEKVHSFIAALDEQDDVQEFYTTFEQKE